MRSVDSTSSVASSCAVSEAATHARVFPVAGPAMACTRSSQSASRPDRAASGSAKRQPSSIPRSSSASSIASSASDASRASSGPAHRAHPERLLLEPEQLLGVGALDPALHERAQRVVDDLDGVDEVGRRAARRRGGVVELVRPGPAAIVPSEVSRSRLDSRALTPRITGPITCMTRWCTVG